MAEKIALKERLSAAKAAFSGQPNQSLLRMAQRFAPVYGEPPRRSTEDWIELYNKSPRMNPIHQIASDVATSSYGIYSKKDQRKTEKIQDTAIEKLLKMPTTNKTITEYVLLYITQVYLMLPSGEAFWIKERNKLGKVTELWPVPPGWVQSIPSITQDFFMIYPQGNMQSPSIPVAPFDMVYFKKPDVNNPYLRGIGRANGIGDEIETDEYMAKYQKRFFFNDALPSVAISMPNADETSIDRAEESWNQKFGGHNNSHKTAFLNFDGKIQLLKQTEKDMDFIESRKYLRDTANQHFSIPPELFGILENSNRSTIDAAYYLYTKNVLRKELKFIDDVLNIQLIPELDSSVIFEHDNVVPEDDEFKLKRATEGLKNGALTVNKWLQENGYDQIGDKGEALYVPLNMAPVYLNEKEEATAPAGEKVADTALNGAQVSSLLEIVMSVTTGQIPRETAINLIMNAFMFDRVTAEAILADAGNGFVPAPLGAPVKPAPEAEPAEPPAKHVKRAFLPEQKERMWLIFDKAATKNEQAFILNLKRYFQSEQDRIVNSLEKSVKAIDPLLDWDKEKETLFKLLTSLWMASLKDGFETTNETFGFGVSFDVVNPTFIDWISEYGAERVKGINDTTKEALRKTLAEGIDAGESIPKLKDRVLGVMGEAKTSRAEKIAKTETHNSVGKGTQETYAAAGVKKKEWLTSIDGRERESHAAINHEVVDIDKQFGNGLSFPGDPSGPPEEVVNCRCVELPVIE
ncbi:MAG: phage portal protein [Eubacteriales bacterium]|jgi:HK97 family phage portal protein